MSIFDTMTEAQELHFLKQVSANMRAMDSSKLASPTSTDPQNKPSPEALQRLHEKIDGKGRWTGGTNSDGYPKVRINQQSELASHVLLKEKGVTLRPGQVVMHKDNDPLNLKPTNLAVGTQKANLKQMRDEGRDRPRGVDQEPDVKKQAGEDDGDRSKLREWAQHAALNLGQAARDVRYLYTHPNADKVAPKGTAHHLAASVVARLPSFESNLYYSWLPPQLHHTPEELAGKASLLDLFRHGYDPWKHPDPLSATSQAKTAAPKWLKEITKGVQAGASPIGNISRAADKLQLKPRLVKNLSMGGQEAAVDLMAGRMPSAVGEGPGLFARKLYKPDSLVARGAHNTDLLAEKKIMTDTARGLSPEAKATVPQFHGFQELHSGTDKVRHISDHEFVPNARHVDPELQGLAAVQHVNRTVVDPLERKGMAMRDLPRTLEGTHTLDPKSNLGNVMQTADGQLKVMDFMPQNPTTPVHMSKNTVMSPYIDKTTYRNAKGNPASAYTDQSINTLRKEVFRPQTAYPVSEYRPSPPTSSMARQPAVSQGGSGFSTPITSAAPMPTRAAPMGSTPVTAVDRPSGVRLRQGQATPATQAASPLRPTPVTAVA